MSLKKVLLLSLIGLIVLAIIFGLVFFFVLNKKDSVNKKVEYYEFKLDEMYTNIKENNSILKINIIIEYTDTKLAETLNKRKARIANDILELLRSKTLEELSGQDGQQNARKDIQNKVIEITNSKNISNIFFTEFIIQ